MDGDHRVGRETRNPIVGFIPDQASSSNQGRQRRAEKSQQRTKPVIPGITPTVTNPQPSTIRARKRSSQSFRRDFLEADVAVRRVAKIGLISAAGRKLQLLSSSWDDRFRSPRTSTADPVGCRGHCCGRDCGDPGVVRSRVNSELGVEGPLARHFQMGGYGNGSWVGRYWCSGGVCESTSVQGRTSESGVGVRDDHAPRRGLVVLARRARRTTVLLTAGRPAWAPPTSRPTTSASTRRQRLCATSIFRCQ